MDLINFRVGQKTISLKILDILLTERFEDNLTSLPNENKSFIGVKDYMDSPTPIFDLGIILNGQSTQSANQAISQLLHDWESKLHEWFKSLQHSLNNSQAFTLNTDSDQSPFMKWLNTFKTDNQDLTIIINRFKEPYSDLLATARQLSYQLQNGNNIQSNLDKQKNAYYLQLKRLFESAKEQVALDYKPIIIFTTKDGSSPHIGLLVDKVEDSISYKKEDMKPLDKITDIGFDIDPQTKSMMRGLIKLEKKHSVLIDPSAIFRPTHLQHQQAEETEGYGLF